MTSAPTALVRPGLRERVAALPAWMWLTGLVALSFAVRLGVARAHRLPRLFPDEYIYTALSRSLGHGSITIRGEPASFPALLEPLLAAPLWLLAGDDVELGYRLVQAMHGLAISLTAIPVYLIARRVRLSVPWSLFCAAFTVSLPVTVFATYVTADAVAWPLALGALAAGLAALDRPTRRAQVGFVALAGLATAARVQYVLLPVAFVLAALVVSRWHVRDTIVRYRLTLALLILPLVAVVVAGPGQLLGYYRRGVVSSLDVDLPSIGHLLTLDGMVLAYAVGIVLVPGALVGLALGLARPHHPAEKAFAAISVAFVGLLLLETALWASNGADRFQERYLIAMLPLAPIAFRLGVDHLTIRPARVAVAAIAGCLFLLATLVPLSGYTVLSQKQDSPTLQAVYQLGVAVGTANASLLVALAASALALLAAIGAWRPHLAAPLAAIGVAVALGSASFAAVRYDHDVSAKAERTWVEASASWIDEEGLGPTAVLQTPFTGRQQVSQQLFWNTSLVELLRMGETSEVDAYGSTRVRIERDGTILAAGKRVNRPLLVEEYASWALLDDARLVNRTLNSALWQPRGSARFAALLAGRYFDGWLGGRTKLTVWPGPTGRRTISVALTLSLPDGAPPVTLDVTQRSTTRSLVVKPGEQRALTLQVDASTPETIVLRPKQPLFLPDGRLVSVQASTPRITETSDGA